MIMSALISQCRREFYDIPKSSQAQKQGDGTTTLFNLGRNPIIEGSYTIKKGTATQTSANFTLDLDSGDLTMASAPTSTSAVIGQFKYANWRDQNWLETINQAIEVMNGEGFFRQVARATGLMTLSAGVQSYNAPSACIDLYEVMSPYYTSNISANFGVAPLFVNWSYQQDANKLVVGNKPTISVALTVSYLRNMQTYAATSATLDVKNDWIEPVKKKAGAIYMRAMASKIAQQSNANIDEGHFSFTNLRTNANDLDNDFDKFVKRKKPTRPAKDIMFRQDQGGFA